MSEPIKKIDLVRDHIAVGQYKKALAIVKTFRPLRGGASKQELDAMTLAYECMVYPEMYRQLGRDIEQTINNGVACLIAKYAQ